MMGCKHYDAASYTSLGEIIPCGGINEQDARYRYWSTIYNEADKLYYTFFTGHKYQLNAGDSRENGYDDVTCPL